MSDQVTVQRLIHAPAEAIFDLLADPGRHHDIDGSGTVVATRSKESRRLSLGDSFGMDMNWGVGYSTRNVVTEFEENRRIAWRTMGAFPITLVATGRTWRYQLEPTDEGTIVRETWDISTEAWPGRFFVRRLADLTRRNMEATLQRIEDTLSA